MFIWLESLGLTPVAEAAVPFLAKKTINATRPIPATDENTAMRMVFLVEWSSDEPESVAEAETVGGGVQAW